MINTNDVEYVYLKLLGRLPTSLEESQSIQLDSIDYLEKTIGSTEEYTNKHNIFTYDYVFENNVYTMRDISGDYDRGCVITNGVWKYESSASFNQCKYLSYNSINIPSITNIEFKLIDQENTLNHTSQSLDMNKCLLKDVISNDNLEITLEKFAFQEEKELFVHQIEMKSEIDCKLLVSHVFEPPLFHNTSTEVIDKITNEYRHLSIIEYKLIKLINIYSCTEEFIFQGSTLKDGKLLLNFVFSLHPKQSITFNFITSVNKTIDNVIEYLNIYNKENSILNRHIDFWSTYWNSNIDVVSKQNITEFDKKTIERIDFITKKALFDMYCDPYSVDLMFQLPSLIMMQPELAKKSLTGYIEKLDFKYNINDNIYLYDKALLSIHIWNYYRITQDKNWLQLVGFPCMKSIAEFLLKFINLRTGMLENTTGLNDVMNTNIFTKYLVSLSYKLTLQAIYDLNYYTVEKYREITNKLKVNYFEEDVITTVNTTDIRVSLGSNNGLYHFDFYDANNDYIGYQFGGTNGQRLSLLEDTTYTFSVDDSLVNHPFKLETRIYNDVNYTTDTIYHTFSNVNDPPYTNDSSVFSSYSLDTDSNLFSIYREKFNHLYGQNAFTTNLTRNVIVPYNNYEINKNIEYVEPYLLLTPYYNTLFDSNKSVLVDTINDNIKYYSKVSSKNEFNIILEAGLTALVSQYKDAYVQKRTQINQFYNKLIESLSVFDKNDTSWGGNNSRFTLLYMMLTCVFELTPYGEINHNRIMSQYYELKYSNRNILPDPFKTIKLTNIRSLQNNEAMIINTLYIDNPIGNLIEGVSIEPILDETNMIMILNIDLSKVFPSHIPNDLMFHIVLQDDGDFTEYNIENMRQFATSFKTIEPIKIELSNPTGILEERYIIEELYNRRANLYMQFDDIESFTKKNIEILNDTKSSLMNPTVYCQIEYSNEQDINLSMVLNTLNNTVVDVFDEVTISIYYNTEFVDPSNILFTEPINSTYIYTIENDVVKKQYKIHISFGKMCGGLDVSIGEIRFILCIKDINMFKRLRVPFTGTVTTRKSFRDICIKNPTNFPPDIHRNVTVPKGLIPDIYTFVPDENIWYPITTFNTISLNNINNLSSHTLTDIIQENNSVYDIIHHNDFSVLIQNQLILGSLQRKCFAKGTNNNNMLMMTDIQQTKYTNFTECTHLTEILDDNGLILRNVYCGNGFTIIRSTTDVFYGIGNNESYNLGVSHNNNTDMLTECVLINNLIKSNNKLTHFCINDKALVLCFDNNKLYGLGFSPLFDFLIKPMNADTTTQYTDTLQTPILLRRINEFIESNQYKVRDIHIGVDHYKLRVGRDGERDQWYGIGRNAYNSMGINNKIESDILITSMKRLYYMESILDINYDKGVTIGTKYKVLPVLNGIPCTYTAVMDIDNRKIYYIGSIDGVSIELEWKELMDLGRIYRTELENLGFIGLSQDHLILSNIHNKLVSQDLWVDTPESILRIDSTSLEELNVSFGNVSLKNGLEMDVNTSFDYELKEILPNNRFTIRIECQLSEFSDMKVTYGSQLEIFIGYDVDVWRIETRIDTIIIDRMNGYDENPIYKKNDMNEYVFVFEKDSIIFYLNDKKLGDCRYNGNVLDEITNLNVTNFSDIVTIQNIEIFDTIVHKYVNSIPNVIIPNTFISQVSHYLDQNVERAFNDSYGISSESVWKGDVNERKLWVWIDLGDIFTITSLRLWQFFEEGTKHSISNFKMFITNNILHTTSIPTLYTINFNRDKSLIEWKWVDMNGYDQFVNVLGYSGDPSKKGSHQQNRFVNYHKFKFDKINYYGRSGRYVYLELVAGDINTWGALNEIKIYGYRP